VRVRNVIGIIRHANRRVAAIAGCVLVMLACGCGGKSDDQPTTRPAKLADRTDDALRDPFGYSPSFDRTDISGGDLDHMDGQGIRKDLDHVFNP
jgi:hypothetical protein